MEVVVGRGKYKAIVGGVHGVDPLSAGHNGCGLRLAEIPVAEGLVPGAGGDDGRLGVWDGDEADGADGLRVAGPGVSLAGCCVEDVQRHVGACGGNEGAFLRLVSIPRRKRGGGYSPTKQFVGASLSSCRSRAYLVEIAVEEGRVGRVVDGGEAPDVAGLGDIVDVYLAVPAGGSDMAVRGGPADRRDGVLRPRWEDNVFGQAADLRLGLVPVCHFDVVCPKDESLEYVVRVVLVAVAVVS